MANVEDIPKTYDEAVEVLTRWHAEGEDPVVIVYSFPDPARHEVRLLEVSEGFPATGKVWALQMGSSAEFPFRSRVAQIHPEEWEQVEAGRLDLPKGWDLPQCRQVWPVL